MERSMVALAGEKKVKPISITVATHCDITAGSSIALTIFGIWRHQHLLGALVACSGSSFVVFCGCSHVPLHTKAVLITLTQEEQSSVILQACTTIKTTQRWIQSGSHMVHNIKLVVALVLALVDHSLHCLLPASGSRRTCYRL